MTVTVPFANFTQNAEATMAKQVVGIQWQANSAPPVDPDGGAQLGCNVEIRIDDIKFVTHVDAARPQGVSVTVASDRPGMSTMLPAGSGPSGAVRSSVPDVR